MRKGIAMTQAGLAWVVLAVVVAQFFFAGLGIFGAATFSAHRTTGYLIVLASLLLLLLALAGWLGRARIGLSALLFGLTIVQVLLASGVPPAVAALHPVNALAILFVALALARRGMAIGTAGLSDARGAGAAIAGAAAGTGMAATPPND